MGNFLENCCKSKKKERTQKEDTQFDQMLEALQMKKPKALEDYVQDYGMNEVFKNFVAKEFEMKNLIKYVQDDVKGIFSMDFVVKVFTTASYWSFILADHGGRQFVQDRRKALREGDNSKYKKCLKQEVELRKKCFDSALWKCREVVQIIPSNWNSTHSHHTRTDKQQKQLYAAQEKGHHMFKSMKAGNYLKNSNLGNMSKRECLAIQKTLVGLTLDQMREFYETIPKSQQKEEYQMLQPMIQDKLLMRTGVEQDQLEAAIYSNKLTDDPDFKDMDASMKAAVESLKKEMCERGLMEEAKS